MAKILSKSGRTTGNTVEAFHVTQSVDAFTGIDAYDITISGSLTVSGSSTLENTKSTGSFTGSFTGDGSGLTGVPNFFNTNLTLNGSRTHQLGGQTITFEDGGSVFWTLGGGGSTRFLFNSDLENWNFVVYGSGADLIGTDAANQRVGINKSSPNAVLDINGDTIITGSLTVTGTITAGSLTASYVNPLTQDVDITGDLVVNGTTRITGSIRMNTGGISKNIRTYDPDSFSIDPGNDDYYIIVNKSNALSGTKIPLPSSPNQGQEMVFISHPDTEDFQISGSGNTINGSINSSPTLTSNQSRSIFTYDGSGNWYASYNI